MALGTSSVLFSELQKRPVSYYLDGLQSRCMLRRM